MKHLTKQITLSLPAWATARYDSEALYPSDEDKMWLAVELSALNVEHGSGGPFGAAVFSGNTNRLISVGVNRVIPEQCSVAHAEMMAFMLAQASVTQENLTEEYVLASSAQPCAMCFGALPWTNVKKLIFGATKEDVEKIAQFDEGPVHPEWEKELEDRGIQVVSNILRTEACKVLQTYTNTGGTKY